MKSDATTVYLVSCVKSKRKEACRAQDFYISVWFVKARRYVEASGCRWFILSAKYDLVEPNREIEPYERTLNKMPIEETNVIGKHCATRRELVRSGAPVVRRRELTVSFTERLSSEDSQAVR